LGSEITIPTLDGSTVIKIHPGTQVGEVITLKGKGMPRFRGYGKGDLLIRVGIPVPEKLTPNQKALLEQLSREFGTDFSKGRKFRL
jgi:molecular chaperone DnaJ